MVSHNKRGTLSVSENGGMRFKRRPSERNICIGDKLKGNKIKGGRYSEEKHNAFRAAVTACANVTRKKK